jgi:ABC-type sugar transport system permease subunit
MAATSTSEEGRRGLPAPLSSLGDNLSAIAIRLLLLMVLDAFTIYTAWQLFLNGGGILAIVLILVVIVINVAFLRTDAMPLRWILPGLAFMIILHIYPVMFTVYTAFTNYSDGHLVEKQVAIRQIESRTYVPEGAITYSWTAYQSPDGTYALWLTDPDGTSYFATETGQWIPADQVEGAGPVDDSGAPATIEGYVRVPDNRKLATLPELQGRTFGEEAEGDEAQVDAVQITSVREASQVAQQYVYDPEADAMIDQETGKVYVNVEGTFTAEDGDTLRPGFPVSVGLENFARIITNPAIRGPFLQIFIWTFIWGFFSVLLTFALGLFYALVMNKPDLPFQRTVRVLMIVPYAIPPFVSVLIWRGLLNPVVGVVGTAWNPGWFTDPFWAKVGVLFVNMWLGYAYMFLITTGALQGIPQDIYEAARVDGAGPLFAFRRITLPLLLISVGPLLIGSFAFNFNNFAIIDLYNSGGPPIAGASTPAGHTDILVSYTYRLAFGGGRGADYGLAAAISIIIFIIVAIVTLINFRYTGMLEEVSENV